MSYPSYDLTFAQFSARNRKRCEAPNGFKHQLSGWALSDWFIAVMGELGEAANIAKKLNRVRGGIPGNTETVPQLEAALGDELADTFIYLDLLIQAAGLDFERILLAKFSRTSDKVGYRE